MRRQRVEPLAFQKNLSGGGLLESGNDAQQSRFARAAFAEECKKFAALDIERDGFKNTLRAEALAHTLNAQEGRFSHGCGGYELNFGRTTTQSASRVGMV